MKGNDSQLRMLYGIMAEEISDSIQYVACSEVGVKSEHNKIHEAILRIHNDLPRWLQQRVAFFDDASEMYVINEES
ncbi:MAG: hypothetical protein EPO24_03045 [Bacteroidetes bacterium]|nr:MAG: hypothetical protein EPO24_03045 [Bacteroidota bacterium]